MRGIIIFFLAIVSLIIFAFIFVNLTLSVSIQEIKNDEQYVLEINVTSRSHLVKKSLDNLTIQVSHKYNKGINDSYDIEPFKEGEYKFYYVPNDFGEYTFNIYGKLDSQEVFREKSFLVEK